MGRTRRESGGRRSGRTGAIGAVCLLPVLTAMPVRAQEVPKNLTLADAITLAERNNPTFLTAKDQQGPADWTTAAAYAHILPQMSAEGGVYYSGAGPQYYQNILLGSLPASYQSYYGLGLSWTLDGSTLFGLSNARAKQRSAEANVDAARFTLATQVAQQYVAVLRAQDAVRVDERQVAYAEQNLKLVQTEVASGAKAGADAKEQELVLGQDRVQLLQDRQAVGDQVVQLGTQIGVALPDSVTLVSRFAVFEPSWSVDSLLSLAMATHPAVRADEASVSASVAAVRQARTAYFPTLTARLGFLSGQSSGQAVSTGQFVAQDSLGYQHDLQQCQFQNEVSAGLTHPAPGYPFDCSRYEWTPSARQTAVAASNAFPFHFNKNPLQLSVGVSIPVFTGFSRQRDVAQASAAVKDARQALRQERLTLRKELTQAWDALRADYQIVQVQRQNQAAAQEVLEQRQRQYAAGVSQITILNLLQAQKDLSAAEQGYLQAVYDFHYNLIRLEAAVGRPLTSGEAAAPVQTGGAGGL